MSPDLPASAAALAFAAAGTLALLSFRRANWSGGGYAVAAITVVPGVQVAAAAVLALLPRFLREEVDGPTPGVDIAHVVQGALAGVAIIVAAVLVSALAMGSYGWSLFKEFVHERRPDGSDNRSFPSGHTSISFAAAATLEKRYSCKAGLPALAVASFVGLARVEADKHYAHDVVAGAASGTLGGLLLTSRHDDRVKLTPWSARGGGGLDFALRF